MKDFKKMVKMADGGKVTSADVSARLEKYQDNPNYNAKEDDSPAGNRAGNAYQKEYKKLGGSNRPDFMTATETDLKAREAGGKAARNVIAKDRQQVKTMSNVDTMGNPLKRGGKVTKKK